MFRSRGNLLPQVFQFIANIFNLIAASVALQHVVQLALESVNVGFSRQMNRSRRAVKSLPGSTVTARSLQRAGSVASAFGQFMLFLGNSLSHSRHILLALLLPARSSRP